MRKAVAAVLVCLASGTMSTACATSTSTGEAPRDDTASLQELIDATEPGATLTLEPRVYEHSGVLTVRVPGVRIDGGGATLAATQDATSALQILADGVTLTDIRLTAPPQGPRYLAPDQHKLVIGADDVAVSRVNIEGSAGAGIFVDGAQNFTIRDVTVSGSRADGLHMTNGAGNGVVEGVRTRDTGDDGVAVVSYQADGTDCRNITVSDVRVDGTRWGRGITVVGGVDITMRRFAVSDTDSAGVYVATEGDPYYTRSVENVTISEGTITRGNRNADIVQGALLVAVENPGTSVSNVAITDISISETPDSALRNVAIYTKTGTLRGVRIERITLDENALPPFSTNAGAESFAVTGWTAGGNQIAVN